MYRLDSRQRKKQKAEELEVDNKHLREQMAELSEELAMFKMQAEAATHEKDQLHLENAQLKEHVNQFYMEKGNLLEEHTKETGVLRKKVQVLEEMVTKYESADAVRASASANTNYDFPITHELSSLTVDGLDMNQWDPFSDFLMGDDAPEMPTKPMETSTLVLAPKKKLGEEKEEAGPSGLLMLLLLCGAWVASKATTSMPVTIPRMPEEVRSDAAVVFDDLMKDHGVSTFQATGALESASSSAINGHQMSFPMHGSNPSNTRLDNIHSQLTRPSKRQEAESAFSLSVKQYEGLTSAEFADPPYSTPPEDDANSPSHRRHIVNTLRAMREDSKGQATANVYTRSLLWERIPNDVVQQFKRMADQTSSRSASVDAE
jgi:regulator of replication initiation timing